jgi:rhodanese-related sulfurtransferase
MTLRTCRPIFAVLAALALAGAPRAKADDFTMISADEVEKLLSAPDVKVFDVNTRETFERGHIPGATFVDSKTLAGALPRDKSARLVFYCKNPH